MNNEGRLRSLESKVAELYNMIGAVSIDIRNLATDNMADNMADNMDNENKCCDKVDCPAPEPQTKAIIPVKFFKNRSKGSKEDCMFAVVSHDSDVIFTIYVTSYHSLDWEENRIFSVFIDIKYSPHYGECGYVFKIGTIVEIFSIIKSTLKQHYKRDEFEIDLDYNLIW